MFSAAVDVKYYAQQQRRPNTVAEKLYWTVLLWRAVRSGAVSSACRAAQAYPYLEKFFSMDSHLIFDLNGLTYHVNELAGQDIENEIEETSGLEIPAASKNIMMDRLLARQKLWSSSGRALVLQGVYSEDGRAATGEEAAHLLAGHWSSVFEAREACQESYEQLRGFVQEADNIGT